MNINVKKLRDVGLTVRTFDHTGDLHRVNEVSRVEIFAEHGATLSAEAINAIRETLQTEEYADVIIEGLHRRIQTMQILEAIEKTGKED